MAKCGQPNNWWTLLFSAPQKWRTGKVWRTQQLAKRRATKIRPKVIEDSIYGRFSHF